MKIRLLLSIFCFPFLIFGKLWSNTTGSTRAVVIGISDYQDEGIPDLKYAHRDAVAFATWLSSSAGGAISKEQIKLLTNEEASIGNILEALEWMIAESKAGDNALIYFSGHGDVESITRFKRGYLLAYNAPSRCYAAGGVLSLGYLEDIIATLSEQGTQAVIITDACRSGNLAGSKINGSQYTSNELAKRFSNEIKILSCQPEEYSAEGVQWGGGHGAFSYHLIDGLYGLADRNSDFQITLREVDRYLEDHVTKEVAPERQSPMTIGDRNARLAFVDEDIAANRKKEKSTQLPMIAAIDQKDNSLLEADSSILELYTAFNQALDDKIFFEPAHACADTFYRQLIKEESMAPLHNAMRRKYAARLQDDAQAAINAILKLDQEMILRSRKKIAEQYKQTPYQLERSAELLGQDHYMYNSLKARSLFFNGLNTWFIYYKSADKNTIDEIIEYYRASLVLEPFAPYTHYFLSCAFITVLEQPDSAIVHSEIAMTQAPTWVYPYATLGYFFAQQYKQFDKSKAYLDKAKSINSEAPIVLQGFGAWHFSQSQFEEAVNYYSRILALDSLNNYAWLNIASSYFNKGHYEESEAALLTSIEIDSLNYISHYMLSLAYRKQNKLQKAKQPLLRSIELYPLFITGRKDLGVLYYTLDQKEEARDIWLEGHLIKPSDITFCENLGIVSIELNEIEKALEYFEKAHENGKNNYTEVREDFKALDDLPAYQNLLKKYYPDQFKD